MGRGNVAKKSLRFHALVKMLSDYQSVAKYPVAASRHEGSDSGVTIALTYGLLLRLALYFGDFFG